MVDCEWGQRVCPSPKAVTKSTVLLCCSWEVIASGQECPKLGVPGAFCKGVYTHKLESNWCFNQNAGNWGRVVARKQRVHEGFGWKCLRGGRAGWNPSSLTAWQTLARAPQEGQTQQGAGQEAAVGPR